MNICNRCFQLTQEEHKDCIEILLPPSHISFNCNLPIGSLIALLKFNNIQISNVKQSYNIEPVVINEIKEFKELKDIKEIKEIKEPIEYFKDINTPPDLKAYVLNNILNIPIHDRLKYYENIKLKCEKMIHKASCRDVFYTLLRQPVILKYGRNSPEHKETYTFKITRDERECLNTDKIKKVKNNNKTPVVYKINKILSVIDNGQSGHNTWGRYISLLLSCGSRPAELLINHFEIDNDLKGNVLVSNLSKKRNNKCFTVSRPIIGYSPDEFINQVCIMKDLLNNKLSRSNLQSIQTQLKKYFNEDVKPSTLRKLYANACYLMYGSGNINVFISGILGHDGNDILSSFHYSTVSVEE